MGKWGCHMKQIILLGATGSIGTQTLDIIRNHADRFELVAFSFGKNIELATEIIQEFNPSFVSTAQLRDAVKLRERFPNTKFSSNDFGGLVEVATYKVKEVDVPLVVNALMGSVGLRPTLAAIEQGRDIALANKETLVMAGKLVTAKAREHGVKLMPVDSEHAALWQCLNGEDARKVKRMIMTASGGAFRDKSRAELLHVTKDEALNHPNWSMGEKITIDSATMMNKGLEVIEAHYLFDLPYDNIETVLHSQSVVHAMVEFVDTSMIAHLGTPDMKIPIAYAMNHPEREVVGNTTQLDLAKLGRLDFKEMDFDRYPCLALAYEAGRKGETYPLVLNAANEEAVRLFLEDKISFLDIEEIVEVALNAHVGVKDATIDEILEIDNVVRSVIRARYN